MTDREKEFLSATVATEKRYRILAAAHDRLVARVEKLEEQVALLVELATTRSK